LRERTDPPLALRLLVGIRFQVLFHSACSRTFHLSLTVLVHYRSSSVFSLGRWASRFPTGLACPVVLRNSAGVGVTFAYRTSTCSGRLFNTFQLATPPPSAAPTTPALWPVWADPRSLATTSGIVSVPLGTEMFQFPRFPSANYGFICRSGRTLASHPGVSPFGHPRI
jgi:hypothetical protein